MDAPNFALASYLARGGSLVHVVAYRVAEELSRLPNIVVHRVPKPGRAYANRSSAARIGRGSRGPPWSLKGAAA